MPLSKDLREFVALLNSNKVEYLVVGAFAVAYHGYPRYTGDLDILIRVTPENIQRVLRSISQFGFEGLGISAQDLQISGRVVQFGVRPNRVDLITSISGVAFEDAWSTRSEGILDGIPVQFIGKDALIRNKESTGRAKDRGDAEELRKRKP
jgi:acetolactate synthase regulatory subunit